MLINAPLQPHLLKQLYPVYFLYGLENFLLDESLQQLKDTTITQGFSSSDSLFIEKEQDWQQLQLHTYAQSLFHPKTLLICYIKLKSSAYKSSHPLINYLNHAPKNKLLIIYWPNCLPYAKKNILWHTLFKQSNAMLIAGQTLSYNKQVHWVKQYCQRKELNLTQDAIALLLQATTNNLLATKQALEKLMLIQLKQPLIDRLSIMKILTNERYFPIFALTEATLQGKIPQAFKILKQLKNENTEPQAILWHISKELRLLAKLTFMQSQQISLTTHYTQHKIYSSKKQIYEKLISSKTSSYWQNGLTLAHQADKVIKGEQIGDIWIWLQQLLLLIGNKTSYYTTASQYSLARV